MTTINTDVKLVGVSNNAFGLVENSGSATAEDFSPSFQNLELQ